MTHRLSLIISLLVLLSSCSEDSIQLSPISLDNSADFYKTPQQIEMGVIAAYDALQKIGQYGRNYFFVMEVRSDNSYQESLTNSGGIYGDIDLFRDEAINTVIKGVWNDSYLGIYRCNIVLNRIETVKNNPKKNVQIGEMKFIRALTYFNLVRTFGDVPLVTVEYGDSFDAFKVKRTPKDAVYKQIILDLSAAKDVLSDQSLRPGGATKSAAFALLGKVHLTLKKYADAISALKSVSGYTLVENYKDLFGTANENNKESLFEIQFTKGGIGEGSLFANWFAPNNASKELTGGVGSTYGSNLPTKNLFESYDAKDLRRDITIGKTSNGTLYTKKYLDVPTSNEDGGSNVIVLRYADVLLMHSEALNEQGYIANGEAFNLLNQIRKRAGLEALTAVELPNQKAFREAVAKERRWELAFENHRWFDLLRTGQAITVMNAHTTDNGTLEKVTPQKLVFPIPQSEINTTNGTITQNEGYK